mgnify:CR=1 FL=1
MSETWYKEECPHCRAINWINNGDISDCTVADVELYRCWSCEKKVDMIEYESDYGDGRCEWGRKHPDDPYRSCDWGR